LVVEPDTPRKLPGAHSVQLGAPPAVFDQEPGAQVVQIALEADEAVPAGHAAHVLVPEATTDEFVPAGQGRQVLAVEAPTVVL